MKHDNTGYQLIDGVTKIIIDTTGMKLTKHKYDVNNNITSMASAIMKGKHDVTSSTNIKHNWNHGRQNR